MRGNETEIRRQAARATGLALAIVLGACSTSSTTVVDPNMPDYMQLGRDPKGNVVTAYKVGNPYEVAGVWYYPSEDYGYRETGLASWYGPGFHGKRTANGEVYDMNAMTAAHKTLPMPSVVRVTNLENGRQIKVRINDRGPFVDGRIIDLSRRAAQMLDVERAGTARVRVELIPEDTLTLRNLALDAGGQPPMSDMPGVIAAPRATIVAETLAPPSGTVPAAASMPVSQTASSVRVPIGTISSTPLPPPATTQTAPVVLAAPSAPAIQMAALPGLYIQAGAFSDINNARRLEAQLSGMGNVFVAAAQVGGQTFHRVRLGPIPDRDMAQQLLLDMLNQGYDGATLIEE